MKMNLEIPRIEILDAKENLGILTDFPAVVRFSPAIRAFLERSRDGFLELDETISDLRHRFNDDELNDAVNDLRELIGKFHQKKIARRESTGISSIYIDLPESRIESISLLKRTIAYFEPRLDDEVFVTLNLKNGKISPALAELYRNTKNRRDRHFNLIFQIPLEAIDQEFVDFIIANDYEVQVLLEHESGHRLVTEKIPEPIQELVSRRLISVKIDGQKLSRTAALNVTEALHRIGVGIVQFGYGECDLFNPYPTQEEHCRPSNLPGNMAAEVAEVLGHLAALESLTPKSLACGAGRWYWAVSEDGGIFPCHRWIRMAQHRAGYLEMSGIAEMISRLPEPALVQQHPQCFDCWARSICGGGCPARWAENTGCDGAMHSSCESIRANIRRAANLSLSKNASDTLYLRRNIYQWARHYKRFVHAHNGPASETSELSTLGKSMLPLFSSGTVLSIKYLHPNQVMPGEIFSYIRAGAIITHRLVFRINAKPGLLLYEKGDNTIFREIKPREVIGIVKEFKRSDMRRPISTDGMFFKSASRVIVFYTIVSWGVVFVIKYGIEFLRCIVKCNFNFAGGARAFFSQTKFEIRSGFVVRCLNLPVKLIDQLTLLAYKIRERIWTR